MGVENLGLHVRCICVFCGVINHNEVPILSKENTATVWCNNCGRAVAEFHTAET